MLSYIVIKTTLNLSIRKAYFMKYKLIVDSCCDFPENYDEKNITKVALFLHVDDEVILDDETFDQLEFMEKMKNSKSHLKTACPSPQKFLEAIEEGEAENVFIVTISGMLSGTYNSAQLAKQLFLEEKEDTKKIYVFNSCSASSGEALVAMKVKELAELDMEFDEIITTVEEYIKEMNTFFVIESLDTLQKNGRISNVKALVANVLNLKPVMGSTDEGTIYKLDQARGMEKALLKMVEYIVEKTKCPENKIVSIAHCNCWERALFVKNALLKKVKFKEILIACTNGVSTVYASDGGIIVAV